MAQLVVRVDQASINETVERYATLRVRRNGKGAGKRDYD
jgi:hypothetical protein